MRASNSDRNRFTLTDQSTNGTFVQVNGQEEAFVRRDSIPIKGEGMIGLGRVPELRFGADDPFRLRGKLIAACPDRCRIESMPD